MTVAIQRWIRRTFDIGPAGTTAKAQLKGTAKFTNQMIQGSIKLVKKDSNGRVLKDVEFVIHSSDGAQVAKAKTDAAGEITYDHGDKDQRRKNTVKRTDHSNDSTDHVTGGSGQAEC